MDIILFLTAPDSNQRINIGKFNQMPIPSVGQKIIYLRRAYIVDQIDFDYTRKEIHVYA